MNQRTEPRKPVETHIFIPLILTAIGRVLIIPFQSAFPLGDNLAAEIVYDLVLIFASVQFVRWSLTWGVPRMMGYVRDIAADTQEPNRVFLQKLATTQIRETGRIIEGLTRNGYRIHNPAAMRPWFERFFAEGGGPYVGVDSHHPAEYMDQYGWYLEVHSRSLDVRDKPTNDVRILTVPSKALTEDYRKAHADYQAFARWHQDNYVGVEWCDPAAAQTLRERYGIGNADVSLWESFAVFFTDEADGTISLEMWFPEEPERNGTTFEKIKDYVNEVAAQATSLDDVAPRLELVDRELANAWEQYVDPHAREQGGVGAFLKKVLDKKRFVFDAAAGIGSDSVYLIKEGFQVFSNEVDTLLAEQAKDYAHRQGVELQLTPLLWETLPQSLPGNMRFDSVLCLGNSLCLVEDDEGRRRCLRALGDSLLADGLLVIDERNFEKILSTARDIQSDPIRYFRPTLDGDIMYRGRTVRGYPAEINPSQRKIMWRFFMNEPPVESTVDIDNQRLRSRDLDLYAFRHGELYDLLITAGFSVEGVYADLQEVPGGATGMPPVQEFADAEFITYVARMPGEHRAKPGIADDVSSVHQQGPGA